MNILVVSDTHGNYLAPLCCFDEADAIDMIIHLGDEIDDAKMLEKLVRIPVLMVPGNCDNSAKEPRELCRKIEGHTFFMTHGDRYRVKRGVDEIVKKAQRIAATVVLYGHTHTAAILEKDGILLVNPGTLMSASQSKSFAILTISGNAVTAEIRAAGAPQQPQPQL
jgi:putative phosphoesterase